MEVKEIQTQIGKIETELKSFIQKAESEAKEVGKVSTETKSALEKLGKDLDERILALEQKAAKLAAAPDQSKSIGEMFTASEEYKQAVAQRKEICGKVKVGSFFKTAIVNATGQNQPLVPAYRVPGIIVPGQLRLTVRDLIPAVPVSSNLVEFVQETSMTNAAAPQAGENAAKAESAMTFALSFRPVQTVAHWIPASKQVLSDSAQLTGHINTRMLYGLKLAEETQLLSGDGTGNNLSGLITEATAYQTTRAVVGDTLIDTVRHAIAQVEASFYDASGIVLNPADWEKIELIKTTGTASSGQYVFADPHSITIPRLWGRPVVATASMPAGHFFVGATAMAASLFDREDATIEVSREHSDFFVKNMVAILAEERLALAVYRKTALVYGAF